MIAWLLALALASECVLDVPADAPFEVEAPENSAHVRVLVELWVREGDGDWLDPMLKALESRGLRGAVLVPLPGEETSAQILDMARRAQAGDHDVGVIYTDTEVPLDAQAGMGPYKRRLKDLRKTAGGVKVVAAPLPSRSAEALLGMTGFRTVLQSRGPATAVPRPAVVFEGQPRTGAVLQAGPYAGPCGVRPFANPFTPAAADRVTQALWGAVRLDGVPVIRVAIRPGASADDDASVLGRWLDEVLLPAGIRPTTPDTARSDALAFFRTGKTMEASALDAGGGRLVSVEEVRAAAEALDDENILPRELPGELNLTEAFLAFALLLAERNEGQVVRLGALTGPATHANSAIDGIVELDGDAVKKIARILTAELPQTVPSAMPVAGKTLNAPELLTAMAATIRGEPKVWPTASPDPNAPGQGWGEATLP